MESYGRYRGTRYCCGEGLMVPIRQWAQENNYSLDECLRLLRVGYLVGSRQGRWLMFVGKNPDWVGGVP